MARKSPTVDEQTHLFRGIAYLKTGTVPFLWGHPLLASSLNALPLLTEPGLHLPTDSPAWQEGQLFVAASDFLWELNESPHRLVFLGRLPTVFLALLLGALVGRWGREASGEIAAIMAVALVVLDPNIIAHGRLVTSDIAVTFFMTLAVYGYWRWATGRGRPATGLLLLGLGMGGAGAAKFSAAALLPILSILALWLAIRRRSMRPVGALLAGGLIAGLVLAAVYRFHLDPLWQDVRWQFDYFSRPHGAYLLGKYSPTGWWYYFPIAFSVKTPLPTLLLLGWASIKAVRNGFKDHKLLLYVLLPPVAYLAISLMTPLNIGYRHLLPMLPFLALFIATTLSQGKEQVPNLRVTVAGSLVGLTILSTLIAWPDFIPYFNLLAGRPENRWRILSDSNLDWGQDLPALAEWQRREGQPLYLSYFGTAQPSAFGLDFVPLPTWESGPEQLPADRQPFNPTDPAPGQYAISVTNLHGLVLGQAFDTFAWFRDKVPLAQIGGSIFLYDVAARGQPAAVVFAGLRPADLPPELHTHFATNDVRIRWLDPATSMLWPAGGGWLAALAGQDPDPALKPFWPVTPVAQSGDQILYRLEAGPVSDWLGEEVEMGDVVTFLGYRLAENADDEITLLTAWQVLQATDRPLKIFVHALDEQGQIAGQWDGLDVDPSSWQPGDVFIQLHRFSKPEQSGPLRLVTGLYDGETLQRLTSADGADTFSLGGWFDTPKP